MVAKFWEQATEKYLASTAHVFILHGPGTLDYAEETKDLVPWLSARLVGSKFDLVILYDPANGIQFPLRSMRELFEREVMGREDSPAPAAPAPTSNPLATALNKLQQQPVFGPDEEMPLPRSVEKVLPLLNEALRLVEKPVPERDGNGNIVYEGTGSRRQPKPRRNDKGEIVYYKVALILPYADAVFPATPGGITTPEDRESRLFLKTWARNPKWRAENAPMLFLVAAALDNLPAEFLDIGTIYPIFMNAPDFDERLAFIEQIVKENKVRFGPGMTARRLATMTAGLSKVAIEDVVVKARLDDVPLTAELAKQRKDELLRARSAGLLESVEPSGNLDDIVGMDAVKDFLRRSVIMPMSSGDFDNVPKGVLFMGPAGTGKTVMAEKLAGESGLNVFYLNTGSLQGSYVGQTEAQVAAALDLILAAAPVAVIVDEAEQQVGFKRRAGSIQSSSVDGNVTAKLLNFMSQIKRGQVLFVLITNYPDSLDPAIIRPGRIDSRVVFTPPADNDERAAMLRAMARKNKVRFAEDVDLEALAPKLEGYTGAEIEYVVNKARAWAAGQERSDVTQADLEHAVWAIIPTGQADKADMLRRALREINDRDLLPALYQEQIAQARADERPAREAEADTLDDEPKERRRREL